MKLKKLIKYTLLAELALMPTGLTAITVAVAQDYQTPAAPIPQIINAEPAPSVTISPDRKTLMLLGRENMPSIAAISEPILRLGGMRINPRNNGPVEAWAGWKNSLTIVDIATGKRRPVALPKGMRFLAPKWSADGSRLAFLADGQPGLELWIADAASATARKLTGGVVNAAFDTEIDWLGDGSGILFRAIVADRGAAPVKDSVPTGPTIREANGRSSTMATYQDLLTSAHDERLFDYYFTSQPMRLALGDGSLTAIGKPGVYSGLSISPDDRYLLTTRLKRPYSYLVRANRFPTEVAVATIDGTPVKTLVDRPAVDNLQGVFDTVPTGVREVSWRADVPATLVWVEAQDGGNPKQKASVRDSIFAVAAPFTAAPNKLLDLENRFVKLDWSNDNVAVASAKRFDTRLEERILFDPSRSGRERVLVRRNSQDVYNAPGSLVTRIGKNGRRVLHLTPDGREAFVIGEGASAAGRFPFIGRMSLETGKVQRTWQARAPYYELPVALIDDAGRGFISERESEKDVPNYFVHDGRKVRALTAFEDRAPQFAQVKKQMIHYLREDGLKLSGMLYLPAGYDKARDGPLPLLMWAYPREYTDPAIASQTVDRGNRFTRPSGASPLLMLTQGYAVLDGPAMPIVGKKGEEPNDSFVEQLTANARAAVNAVVAMGIADRDRIAIGGHSYGAFMTANLLAHTDLFRAGIAQSGAYNRTLTPFGFQYEQRSYWEATKTYTDMSPFTYVRNIKAPILLTHGTADENSGTFPVQSDRFYAALKGAGANVRYVELPEEGHSYQARESHLHLLWEMTNWLDKYVKNAPPR